MSYGVAVVEGEGGRKRDVEVEMEERGSRRTWAAGV
jgi:hypothetical protein